MSGTTKIEYRYLGRSGLKVSCVCLGTMMFGERQNPYPGQCDAANSHALLDRFFELGGNFIDTADLYSLGQSEAIIGQWMNGRSRDDVVLATKVGLHSDSQGLSRRSITQSVERSLERLQTHYIDLYQTHFWDKGTPAEETVRTFDDLVRCGKIRYGGNSNLCGWMVQKMADITDRLGLNPFISLQQRYSLGTRDSEWDAFAVCNQVGIGVMAWGTLMSGLLTGKYKRGDPQVNSSQGTRLAWLAEDESRCQRIFPSWTKLQADTRLWNTLDVLTHVANTHNRSVSQVAQKWVLHKNVASIIIGSRDIPQLEANMAAGNRDWELSPEEMLHLDEVSNIPLPYEQESFRRMGTGNASRYNRFNPQF
ncbi:uncharacterized oxidoreductase YrpG-like [Haliotis rufescens]|uniref:uncharacterized oxidoreductase YrpG-like n=1 Tax=Haliotis rufescens TaxID=6454 RepID=UPI00201EE9A2|nr:uncharacterized oxidoreductase YrpG-like [Haliotis rufescens]